MVRTYSTMLPLGSALPAFDLPLVLMPGEKNDLEREGPKRITDQSLLPKPLLLMIICAHCPFVKHLEDGISGLARDYQNKVQILAISSNSLITHPQDGPEYLARQMGENAWTFPYLLDLEQSFSKALRAACTPDFFLFSSKDDASQTLRYRGQFDESRPGNGIKVTGADLRAAMNAVLDDREVSPDQKPSIGCNIKWHPGEEPPWFI